jgi:ribosome-associated protein
MEIIRTDELKNASSDVLAREIVKILIEKKANDIKLFDVKEGTGITDFYINVTGRSLTQVAALADEVAYKLSEQGVEALRIEGKRGNAWILVDYGNVIVNVFDKESREFYNLDRLMPAGSERDISEIVARVDAKLKINSTEE